MERNDFMGNLLAWKRSEFKVMRVLNTIPSKELKNLTPKSILEKDDKKLITPWSAAGYHWRWLIGAHLQHVSSKKEIVVVSYHAPVFEETPPLFMVLDLTFSCVEEFAGELPTVFMGDFNMIPGTPVYSLITEQTKSSIEFEVLSEKFSYTPKLKGCFQSGLKLAKGSEPKFTTRSKLTFKDKEFQETIDYIFLSNVKATNLIAGEISEEEKFYPTKENPSDHLPISLSFSLL